MNMAESNNNSLSTKKTPEPCPICGGVGFVRLNVPVGHPQFGKAVPCVCKRQEMSDRRLARLRQVSNLEHMQNMTFGTFLIQRRDGDEVSPSLVYALDAAREFAADPTGWLVFTGPYGCGKTHLAAAIANDRVARGLPVLFVVVPDLLDYLRASYAPNSPASYDERFDQVRTIELLVLDDLGTQNTTPWAAEKLYQLLNYRYYAKLPTVITTNQTLWDMEPRLASRLKDQELVKLVPIQSSDFRIVPGDRDETFGSLTPYKNLTLAAFSDRHGELETTQVAVLRRAVKQMQDYAVALDGWLILRGGFGVGKTHLAAAVANKVASSGQTVLFVVVADLLDHLRATFQPGSAVSYDQRFNEVRRAWLLVLDDLGTQNVTPWAQEKLFQILNYRYVSRLRTIITLSFDSWERLDERLKSRFLDTAVCTMVDLDIPPFRGSVVQSPVKPRRSTRQRL